MKIFIVGILILLVSNQSGIDKKNTINDKYIISSAIDTSIKLNVRYPILVEYTNSVNADTMLFYVEGNKFLVTPNGVVIKNNEPLFEIHPEGNIQKLYPFIIDDEIVLFYSFSTPEGESGSYAKRISFNNKNTNWAIPIYGFNLARPVLVSGFAYISTIGFVGKLNIRNGEFIWKFDDFFKNGNFICFNEPLFYKDSIVLFTEKSTPVLKGSSILVDDKHSCVLKINK